MTIDALPPLPGLSALLAQRGRAPVTSLTLSRRSIAAGLEAVLTEDVMARFVDGEGRRHSFRFIAKHLRGRSTREAEVYRALVTQRTQAPSPRLLACERSEEGCVLYLEPVVRAETWPWSKRERTADVLDRVARFHLAAREAPLALPRWDYERELASMAVATLRTLEEARRCDELAPLRRGVPAVKRLVLGLPRLRRELFASAHGTTALHGDLHSGNVLVRRRARRIEPVLLDWGRARVGSPLEDVSSWLQSLGYWEPEARRRHDTLLSGYLGALGRSAQLSAETRESYWLAAASNVLSGALCYHLHCARTATQPRARAQAAHLAQDALRVLRRADAAWS